MIVRINNGYIDKFFDCVSASIIPDIEPLKPGEKGEPPKRFNIIFIWVNGKDSTFTLCEGDKIYYMNNEGKTINSDMRMCCE